MVKNQRIKELVLQLNQASTAYYKYDNPIMTDQSYDKLYDELANLEKETGLIFSNSPTQKVQGMILEGLQKITHTQPMLSADKTKSTNDIIKFSKGRELITSWKEDGLTLVLRFKNGNFDMAITRGDGVEGEIVTESAITIVNLPLTIPYLDELELRGECVMTWEDFNIIKDNLFAEGKECGHPRNVAGGALRQLDISKVRERTLYFKAFDITKCNKQFKTKKEQFKFLTSLGFETVEYQVVTTPEEIQNIVDNVFIPEQYKFPVDGIIFEFNDIEYGKSLGQTAKFPLSIMAFKWKDDTTQTIFRGIEFNPTRTGFVSMTALYDEVRVENTRISRAIIPNVDYFEKYQFGIGDTIEVYKANKIIPQVYDNLTKSNTYKILENCPCCNAKLEIKKPKDSKFLYCPNSDCPAKSVKKFSHFVSKSAMNIDGLSEATLEKFINNGWLKTFSDIYKLSEYKTEIINMDGFGEKSYNKLIQAIENSRNVKLENFIVALGIDNIGKTASKAISKYFNGSWVSFENAYQGDFDFTNLDDFGQTMNKSIYEYLSNGRMNWYDLVEEVIFIKPEALQILSIDMAKPNKFQGKTIVITGSFENYTRDTMREKLENMGAKVSSSVSKKTDYVMVGTDAGSKLTKARELGIKILNEKDI